MSENLPVSPLRDLIRRAAERKPEKELAVEARQKHHETALLRAQRTARSTCGVRVLVCDTSFSMIDVVRGKKKIKHLRMAVDDCLQAFPGVKIIAFSSEAEFVGSAKKIPRPSGSTDLAAALKLAAELKPEQTVVISDGCPDYEAAALKAARAMSGTIDVVYCGSDKDWDAVAFMQALAECGCGSQVTWESGHLSLGAAVNGMLMLGSGG